MQLGVILPQTELASDAGALRAYAQGVQELGYQHVLAYDHVVGADPNRYPGWKGPYTSQHAFQEPLTLYSFFAGVAARLELVPGVIVLPQRQTVLVAKQAAQVDILTRGRFRLGVGLGWNPVEYEALGMNFADRARRFEEQIQVLRLLWTQPVVDFSGQYHKITAAGLNPLPVQRPIPIWIGGSAEVALKRAAELGDGFFPQQPLAGGWRATLDRMRGWREASGKSWSGFGIEARLSVFSPQRTSGDTWRSAISEWAALGATHLSVNTMGGGLRDVEAHLRLLREVWEECSGTSPAPGVSSN